MYRNVIRVRGQMYSIADICYYATATLCPAVDLKNFNEGSLTLNTNVGLSTFSLGNSGSYATFDHADISVHNGYQQMISTISYAPVSCNILHSIISFLCKYPRKAIKRFHIRNGHPIISMIVKECTEVWHRPVKFSVHPEPLHSAPAPQC